ncbi:MAG TPA: hypothetical protein VGK22_03110 [Candidatus Angelobacter sp.]|jgi:hypothetical protein
MLIACFLLMAAVLGGTLLTFLFDRTAPRAARLCMGAPIGLALMATAGFLLALCFGLGAVTIILSAIALLLPLLLLINDERRALILSNLRSSPAGPKGGNPGYLIFYLALTILLGVVFGRAAFEHTDGLFTGVTNNLGDLPLHLQVINSFAQGQNLPPEDPTFAGIRFAYPFLVDFLTAMLVRSGCNIITAMWLQNMVLVLAFAGLLHYWTLLLTRNRLAGVITPLLVLFSGGMGWWLLFSDASDGGGLFSTLANLPHDYTIVSSSILRWGNSITTLLIPQRSILFGLPLAITIFCQWWLAISQQEGAQKSSNNQATASTQEKQNISVPAKLAKAQRKAARKAAVVGLPSEFANAPLRRMLAAGLLTGVLPLIHAHTFLVVMAVSVCLTLIFRSPLRGWLLFFAVALVVSAPEILWLANTGGVKARNYLGWQPGWDHGTYNVVWFWFVNTGLFIPLLVLCLALRMSRFVIPSRLLKFYAPFLFCFIIPNLIKLAPWVWDNIKVLFIWYVASAPLVAWFLARWWQQRSIVRWLAPAIFATLVLAGCLDVTRVASEAVEHLEFDSGGIAAAAVISAQAAPRAVVLHAPTYNTPVFLTGRRSLLGFPAWMWSRGIDFSQRNIDIQRIYSGDANADALLRQYGVDYVLIGPAEFGALNVNQQFWQQHKKLWQGGAYRIFETKGP